MSEEKLAILAERRRAAAVAYDKASENYYKVHDEYQAYLATFAPRENTADTLPQQPRDKPSKEMPHG